MEMDTFFVYVLQSLKDYSFYIGECDDLDKRMSKHFEGLSKYSATKRPWRLVYFEKHSTRTEVIKREHQLKSWKSSRLIQKLIDNWRSSWE
jgi:putative endonuclease